MNAEEITPRWLTDCLAGTSASPNGCAVTSVISSLHRNQGALSQVCEVSVEWECDGRHAEVSRFIAKLPSAFASVRDFAGKTELYRNEARWYSEFGVAGSIPIPEVYFILADEEPEAFCILMEDMRPSIPGSARPSLDLVERGVDVLARFHARWWQSEEVISNRWLIGVNLARDEEWIRSNEVDLFTAAKENRVRYAERYPEIVFQAAQETAAAFRRIRERSQSRPRTLLHGDFTTRQFFVPAAEGGRFAVGDWQTASAGPGAEDFARHISIQLDPVTRQANEDELIRRYHDGLKDAGVRNYSLDELRDDIRWGMWRTLCIQTRAFAAVDDTQVERVRARAAAAGEPDPQTTNAARMASCLEDHDYLGLF